MAKSNNLGTFIPEIWSKSLLEYVKSSNKLLNSMMPKIIGYKKVKEPIWLEVDVPVIEKHYYQDDEGEYEKEFEGYLLTTKKVKVCKIGTKIVDKPIYEKPKKMGETIMVKKYESKKS